ncbi:MAG: META domain-containing protein [Terrimicrobiaceae bacterium]
MPDDKSKYSITFKNDGRVAVRLDCNRESGTWKSAEPNQLQFGSLALTRASVGRVPCTTGWRKDSSSKHSQ